MRAVVVDEIHTRIVRKCGYADAKEISLMGYVSVVISKGSYSTYYMHYGGDGFPQEERNVLMIVADSGGIGLFCVAAFFK